jgi:hypothetical protein
MKYIINFIAILERVICFLLGLAFFCPNVDDYPDDLGTPKLCVDMPEYSSGEISELSWQR